MRMEEIQRAVVVGQVRVTDHAKDEADNDSLTLSQVFESVHTGEVIEDYPLDRPYPSCLISGRTNENLPVHSVWAYNAATAWAVLVTVYKPDPERWVEFRKRVKK